MLEIQPTMVWVSFGLSMIGGISIFALSILATVKHDFQFFPPPSKQSWQHKTFIILFRLYLYPLIALSVINLLQDRPTIFQYGIGMPLLFIGFGLAFWITFKMGWRNAFGEKRGLKTTGWFSWSRNPVYVFTWIGLIGWGLFINDWRVWCLLALWGLMYWAAPRFEEPWLEREYGDTYSDYKARVPRFF